MRLLLNPANFLLCLFLSASCSAECIPFPEAGKHIGETRCVTGKVMRVEQGSKGVHYLDFCEDYHGCPFTAVVFASDLKHIGDVRQLQGRVIEIHGDVKAYDGRAEIIISESWQLGGSASRIPPLPKNYDVEKRGNYSAGTFSHPKTYSTSKKRQPEKLPLNLPENPED
ncbi:MAG TPA: OB-fold nucleic acid binding domain-containing protein [Terriglobales bacterium]|nr:OB-fold nucleic acid binding domain-containing protein [Terriglobales bacterium]